MDCGVLRYLANCYHDVRVEIHDPQQMTGSIPFLESGSDPPKIGWGCHGYTEVEAGLRSNGLPGSPFEAPVVDQATDVDERPKLRALMR